MSAGNDDHLKQIKCVVAAAAGDAQVIMGDKIYKEFRRLENKQQARLVGIMKRWCLGSTLMPTMMNRNEGRTNGQNLRLEAFKAFKIRLYGYETNINKKRSFVIVDWDPVKKQNRASPTILERAKKRVNLMNTKLKDPTNDRYQ